MAVTPDLVVHVDCPACHQDVTVTYRLVSTSPTNVVLRPTHDHVCPPGTPEWQDGP